MDKLQQKYRNDILTPDELRRLREEVNSMSDDRLEDSLREAWESAEASSSDTHRLDELKMRIDQRLFPSHRVCLSIGRCFGSRQLFFFLFL